MLARQPVHLKPSVHKIRLTEICSTLSIYQHTILKFLVQTTNPLLMIVLRCMLGISVLQGNGFHHSRLIYHWCDTSNKPISTNGNLNTVICTHGYILSWQLLLVSFFMLSSDLALSSLIISLHSSVQAKTQS